MPYVRTDDRVRIYYEEHGPTDPDATGSPLVLAYGIGGNADLWDVNVPALAARHRLVLWEPRGHARSDSPEDPARFSFARWVLDLKAVLDGLRLRTAHVGGLSLGAGIATRFTLAFPARVRSLLVTNSSSAAGLPLSPENLIMRAQSIKVTLERGMDAMAEFAMASNPNVAARLALDPSSKDEFYAYYRRLTPIGYANALRALLAMDHITERLARIRMPVLLIGGDRDPSLGPMKVMHEKIRGARLVVLSPENLIMRAQSIKVTLERGMDAMAEFAMASNPNVAARLALDPSSKDEFYAYYRRLTPIGYANALRALLAMDHITERLPSIRLPVLLIGGDRDPSLGPMKVMHAKVRGARLVVLSPASHFANRDQPEAWNRAALEFLAHCDAGARGRRRTRRR